MPYPRRRYWPTFALAQYRNRSIEPSLVSRKACEPASAVAAENVAGAGLAHEVAECRCDRLHEFDLALHPLGGDYPRVTLDLGPLHGGQLAPAPAGQQQRLDEARHYRVANSVEGLPKVLQLNVVENTSPRPFALPDAREPAHRWNRRSEFWIAELPEGHGLPQILKNVLRCAGAGLVFDAVKKAIHVFEADVVDAPRPQDGTNVVLENGLDRVGGAQPFGVDMPPSGELIAGGRRLAACKALGWSEVPVRVVDLDEIVLGEFAENAIRKDFLPSEIDAIRRTIEPIERAKATSRKFSGRSAPNGGETRDKVAAFAGVSGRTVEKIAKVVEADFAFQRPRRARVAALRRPSVAGLGGGPCTLFRLSI
jgi:hypothetical protein